MARLGLDRPDLRAWAMYDWAISGFQTIVMTAVFPIFFARVPAAPALAAGGDRALRRPQHALPRRWWRCSLPSSARVADYLGIARRLLFCVHAPGRGRRPRDLRFIGPGDLTARLGPVRARHDRCHDQLRVLRVAAATASPPSEDVDRVSSAGYALGYIGGGILLAVCLVAIQFPAGGRARRGGRGLATRLDVRGDRGLVAGLCHSALPPRARAAAADREGRIARARTRCGPPSPAWARPSARSAGSARRSCCWRPSSSTTTASRPSSRWPPPTAPRSAFPTAP